MVIAALQQASNCDLIGNDAVFRMYRTFVPFSGRGLQKFIANMVWSLFMLRDIEMVGCENNIDFFFIEIPKFIGCHYYNSCLIY